MNATTSISGNIVQTWGSATLGNIYSRSGNDLWLGAGSGKNVYVAINESARMRVNNDEAYIWGTLGVSGAKNAVHITRVGMVGTPAYETAESYLGDIQGAKTHDSFLIEIQIDELFGDTVNTSEYEYHVFRQSYSDGNIWVSERTPDHFTVESSLPNTSFVYEIKAKRRGYENERLVRQEVSYKEIEEIYKETK